VLKLSAQRDLMSTASLDLVHGRLTPAVNAAREKGSLVFDLLDTFLRESGEMVVRLTDDFASHPIWRAGLRAALDDLLGEVALLHEGLRLIRERMESDTAAQEVVSPLLAEIKGVARRLEMIGDGLVRALRPAENAEPSVRWIEVRGRDRNVAATVVPLDIAPILREDLWKRVDSAVITSATLANDERFTFLVDRLGLDDATLEPATAIFPSPFDFARQAVLAVPTDLPAPNVDAGGHFAGVVRVLLDLADASDGGLFALFTSHRDVRAAAAELRARGADRRWTLLVHGEEESRDQLLRRFRESGRAVLLGTASFWEGVDVAGDALRGLLIAKLPFRVPTEPLTAAHCEAIAARGGDAFTEYMLPHASLRLKQGFGRLIRATTDRGVIVLCDPRVMQKAYGQTMLRALPPARRVSGAWEEIVTRVREFYSRATR
jgi:ATP-dependent DNA helicase DinG